MMSKRYSMYSQVIKQHDEWGINQGGEAADAYSVTDIIFNKEMRREKRKKLIIWTGFMSLMFVYITFLLGFFWR